MRKTILLRGIIPVFFLLIGNTLFAQQAFYVNDNSTSGDIYTSGVGNNSNTGTAGLPFATINYAISQAQAGDIIWVDAGTYAGQVLLDKAITLQGAGAGTTIINASTAAPVTLPNLPAGILYSATAIGNVGIKNLTINSGNSVGAQYYGISLQTGGEISGCEINGAGPANGNGIYIQKDDSDPKTISILNNHLHHIGFLSIKINVPHIIATVNNNILDVTGSGYGMGLVAGGEPHLIDGLEFIGNKVIGVTGFGVKVNCSNSNVTISNNSFEKAASEFFTVPFIQNTGSNSINASCNWFGSADAEFVRSRIQGNNISYAPWLSNGTDNSNDIGFQSLQNVCNGRQTKFYVNDNSQSGDVFTAAMGSNANNGFSSKPFATISYAIAQAQNGDTIFVDAGTYAEQITIDKGLIIIGAGRDNTLIVPPGLPYVASPGSSTEKALIQTTQNIGDVHISNLSATGDQLNSLSSIVLQTGGSVKNCKVQGGSQGIYIRVESGSKNAVVENNIINAQATAVNLQGSGLSGSITNNSIAVSNPAGSAAVFFGIFLGPVAQMTISGNSINGLVFGGGMNASITQNSIVGGNLAIGQSGGNAISATCNWFGTNEAEQIKSKIIGNVNYSPWLTDGTDNSSDIGFQPIENVCNGRQNKFYVNDASTIGDVFTTAIGNNANNGFSSTPFATLDYAISQAQNGDSIFVDAGTYVTPNLSIGKSITIIGTNYNVSPNNPDDRLAMNPTKNAEALIQGSTFFIASHNVTLQGLTFNPGAKSLVTLLNTGVNNFTFKRNYSKVTSGVLLLLNGPAVPSGQLPVFGNYFIEDNRFESQATAITSVIGISNLTGVTVNANTFFTPAGSPPRLLSNSQVSNTVANYIYSNNISYASRNEWFSSGAIASAKIENNISLHGQRSLVIQPAPTINSNIEVRNNHIETDFAELSPIQYFHSGAASPGILVNLLIENNTIIQNPAGRTSVPAAILAQGFTPGSNTRTTIRNNKINFIGNYNSLTSSNVLGVSFTGRWNAITVEENEIAFNGTNLTNTLPASGPLTSGISISSDNGANTIPVDAVINITGNKMTGFKNSIAVYDGSNAAPNSFVGYGNLPIGVTTIISNNSFTGDSISINNGTIGQALSANCNWYGTAAAQVIASKVSNGSVIYSTWLTSGTDSDIPATGFQPATGSCNGTPVTVTLSSANNVTCLGANNGSIAINISGGTPTYTIAWAKDDEAYSSKENITSLSPGTYGVTITDANGSVASIADIVISEPLLLTASASGSNVNCFGGSNGSALVTTEGGTTPYSYLWSNGATTDDISNLPAGNYIVTITDANGCTATANYQVIQPTLLTATATPTSTSCFNSISVVANGGKAPYSYLWSNGATTSTISSIAAGTYSVAITDANGCTTTASATVTANEAFNPSASATDVSCYGGANGSITVTNVNAVAPFLFSIDGGLHYQAGATFSGLAAGTYTITVKDKNGCTGFVTKTILQPSQLIASIANVQNTCYGQSAGAININVTGGTSGYTYSWSGTNGFVSTQKNITNLPVGTYHFTVADSKGCTATLSNINVTSTSQIKADSVVVHIFCKGETNGSIVLNPSGGSGAAFSYLWSTGATTNSINNLGVGNYNITITDVGTGCSINRSFSITQPASLVNLSVSKTNATSCASLGKVIATGSGGTPGYQYKLDNGNYQESGTFSNLYAGTYTVWIKDAGGCTKSASVSITDNGSDEYESNNSKTQARTITVGSTINARLALAADVDWFKFTTPTENNSYTITVTHPSVNYSFAVYPSSNGSALVPASSTATSKTYVLSAKSTYYINITGALSYICYQLNVTASPLSTLLSAARLNTSEEVAAVADKLSALVFPNPHKGNFTMKVESPLTGKATIELFNETGQKLVERIITVQKGSNNLVPFTGIRPGAIFYTVRINDLVTTGKIIGAN